MDSVFVLPGRLSSSPGAFAEMPRGVEESAREQKTNEENAGKIQESAAKSRQALEYPGKRRGDRWKKSGKLAGNVSEIQENRNIERMHTKHS